jgi:hypothetical protein
VLFRGDDVSSGGRNYDVAPDGQRFLMVKVVEPEDRNEAPQDRIVYVQHWSAEAGPQAAP